MEIDCTLKKNKNKKSCKKAVGEAHFTIILPKADNSGNKIKPKQFNKYVDQMNRRFGGSTTKPITLGCWIDPNRKNKLTCETGLAIESFVDFDSDPKLKKLDAEKRKAKMNNDYKFMQKLAKESAKDFGQDSVPVIFDNISDVSLNKGKFKKKIARSKLTGKKVNGKIWEKNI